MSPMPDFMHIAPDFGLQIYDYFKGGGVIMYPLLLVAIYMWTLILNGYLHFIVLNLEILACWNC